MGNFDAAGFYRAVDAVRKSRGVNSSGMTWKQVSEESGVGAWTLSRLAQGGRPDVDTLAALSAWSGLDPSDFIIVPGQRARPNPEPLAMISTQIRKDPNLDEASKRALDELIKATYERIRRKE